MLPNNNSRISFVTIVFSMIELSMSVPCKNGGELSGDGTSCKCYDGFQGPDCNVLFDFCQDTDSYNEKCAPGACVSTFDSFWCTRCKDYNKRGLHCTRDAGDATKLAWSPYFAYRPKVQLFEDLHLLVSLEDLGSNLTVKVKWGDGAEDFRVQADFYVGELREEIQSLGLDALAPDAPSFDTIPKGRRLMVRLKHAFNRKLSAKGPVKNWLIFINSPPGPGGVDMQHEFPIRVEIPPDAGPQVELGIPELGNDVTLETRLPRWSRKDSLQVLAQASVEGIKDLTFTFSALLRVGTAAQVATDPVVSPDKKFVIPAYSLPFGKHGVKFSAWNGTRLVEFVVGFLMIVPAPLRVVLLGGSARTVTPREPLLLDAGSSVDLNEPDLRYVTFHWSCTKGACPFNTDIGDAVTVPQTALHDGQEFVVRLEARRFPLEPLILEQAVSVQESVVTNVAITCERNCGADLGTLWAEMVSLRAVCHAARCPPLSWTMDGAPAATLLPLGARGARFVIEPPTLREGRAFTVNLSVPVATAAEGWLVVSSYRLDMAPRPNHTCSSSGAGLRTIITCEDHSEPRPRWRGAALYKFFQRTRGGVLLLVGYTFTGIGAALVFLKQPVEVVATSPWGAEWSVNLTVAAARPSMAPLDKVNAQAEIRYRKGEDMVATAMLASALNSAVENNKTPSQAQLAETASLIKQHLGSEPHPALWWQYMGLTALLTDLGAKEAGTFLDDMVEQMGPLLVGASDQLVQLARDNDPPSISTPEVYAQSREVIRVVTHMTLNADSELAQSVRNLTLKEDRLEPDYELYTDLVPDHLERERKFRVGARAAMRALTNAVRAEQWRVVPQMPPLVVDIDSSAKAPGLGRIFVWSQVNSMSAIAGRQPDSTRMPEFCDFHVDLEEASELDETSDLFGMTVAFIVGRPSWFEPVPAKVQANTPAVALLDLQYYVDGPAGAAPNTAGLISVTLPTAAGLNGSEAMMSGQLSAETNPSDWSDHVKVHNLHAFDGTGVVQVVFPASGEAPAAGTAPEMVVVLQNKWPLPEDFGSPRAVVLRPQRAEEVVLAVEVPDRRNAFVHLGVALTNNSLEAAAARGLPTVSLNYSFLPLNLACKRWNEERYKWVTEGHKEVWQLSGSGALTCSLEHLSLFSGLVVVPPHYVHPLRDAKLFLTLHRNWLVFSYVALNLFVWLAWLLMARRRDRREESEWRVVVLDDIAPEASYPYLVTVFSGNLGQGQTTAYVGIRIVGDLRDSGPHMLSHAGRLLSRSYDDWFVLLTEGSLGELGRLELWTDCAGLRPYWYCEKVLVEELATGRVWTFPAYCWLSLEHGDRRACATLTPGQLEWRHRFYSLFKASVRGDHTWTSVFFRHPRMTFTRAQRLTVAFTEHFLDMLVSIMFFNVVGEQATDLTPMSELLGRAFVVSAESCIITVPSAVLINWLFQVEDVESTDLQRSKEATGRGGGDVESGVPWSPRSPAPRAIAIDGPSRPEGDMLVSTPEAATHAAEPPEGPPGTSAGVSPGSPREGPPGGPPGGPPENPPKGRSGSGSGAPGAALITPADSQLFPSTSSLRSSVSDGESSRTKCSGYRRLRIRTHPRPTGHPTLVVYVGGHSKAKERVELDLDAETVEKVIFRSEERGPTAAKSFIQVIQPPDVVDDGGAGAGEVREGVDAADGASESGGHKEKTPTSEAAGQSTVPPAGRRRWWQRNRKRRAPELRADASKDSRIPSTESSGGDMSKKRTPSPEKETRRWTFRQRQTWRVILGWVLCVAVISTCAYFTVLYGLKYGWQQSVQWLITMVTSLVLAIFIVQPLKIIVVAFIFAKFFNRGSRLEEKTAPRARPVVLPPLAPPRHRAPGTTAKMYRKLTRTEAEVLLVLRRHRQELTARALDTLLWVLWMVLMYGCVVAASDTLFYYMQKHVSGMVLSSTHTRSRPLGQFFNVFKYDEVYEYLNSTVVGAVLHRKARYNSTPEVLHPYVAFAADNVTRMIGVVRLRQQRIQRESSCLVAEPFRWLGSPCYTDFSRSLSDREDYGEGWSSPNATATEDPSLGEHALSVWRYRRARDLDTLVAFGKDSQFGGGGYLADLGRIQLNAQIELMYLSSNGWLDARTRGLLVELVLYSPSTDIFCDVFLFLERTAASSFLCSSKLYAYRLGYAAGKWSGMHLAFLFLLILVSVVMVVREVVTFVRVGRRKYPWNWFDVILVLVIVLNAGMYFGVNSLLNSLLDRMKPLNPKLFISFQFATLMHSTVLFGLGVLVVLATVRCWRVLSFATHFQVVKTMLRLAYRPLLALLSYLMLVQLQFALLFMLITGTSQENLHSVQNAYVLLLAYLVDYTADYDEFADSARDTALILVCYWVFVAFMYFFFLNFFLGIVSMAFESAGMIVRQQEIEGFSMANLVYDELRYLLHIPGGRLRRDSSLFNQIRKTFVHQKDRIHGETLTVARAELGAMNVMFKLSQNQPVSEEELEGTLAMILLNVATPLGEMVKAPGPTVQMSTGQSWNGEELLDINKLHTIMETLNERSVDRDLAVSPERIADLKDLLDELQARAPSSAIPVMIRVRRGSPDRRRGALRLADLHITRRRCVQVRFRLRRLSAPQEQLKPPWRP